MNGSCLAVAGPLRACSEAQRRSGHARGPPRVSVRGAVLGPCAASGLMAGQAAAPEAALLRFGAVCAVWARLLAGMANA